MDRTTKQPQRRRGRGRPTVQIVLTDQERATLERWARRRTSSQALALRCQLVLACAEGLSNVQAGARLGVHFTPTYSSWLNLVQRWFAELTSKWRKRGTHRSVGELTASIQSWIDTWNDDPRPFVWTKTADEILDSLTRYLHRISGTRH